MKFGVREITDVVFKATADNQQLGGKTYSQYDPILFFESAKTSTLESAVATVYAQGGRGNPRLLAWDGDKTATFTFEDALISPRSFAALSGADLISGSNIKLHLTERGTAVLSGTSPNQVRGVTISGLRGHIPTALKNGSYIKVLELDAKGEIVGVVPTIGATFAFTSDASGTDTLATDTTNDGVLTITGIPVAGFEDESSTNVSVIIDFYTEIPGQNLEISAYKFGGYYYVEANTLFRGIDGRDYPAQFTIPKAKVQSNFTFSMASTGDPSTFSFTMDAFPAVTRSNPNNPVMFALDIADVQSDVI